MSAWTADDLPSLPTREVVLYATREHDNGWQEVDVAPMWNRATGRPHDFISVPDGVKRVIWPLAARRAGETHPYAGALVAEHALTVFRGLKGDEAWTRFFDTMTRARDDLLSQARTRDAASANADLSADYRIVFLGDLLSLIFCNGWTQPFEAGGRAVILSGDTLRIQPDPFGGLDVPFQICARQIPDRPYDSDEALVRAFAEAPVVTLRGRAVGGSMKG